jgi:uncharacterized protein YkwD
MNSRFKTLFSTIIFLFIGINFCNSQDYINFYSEHSSNSFLNEKRLTESVNGEQINIDLLNATIFYLTNIERRKNELIEFDFGANLYLSAQLHSDKMIQLDFFSHTNKQERKWREPKDRILHFEELFTALGENVLENNLLNYKGKKLSYRIEELENGKQIYLNEKGEQIHYSTYLELANRLVQQWMNSEPHKKNILSKSYSLLACACAINPNKTPILIRCTQNFGRL